MATQSALDPVPSASPHKLPALLCQPPVQQHTHTDRSVSPKAMSSGTVPHPPIFIPNQEPLTAAALSGNIFSHSGKISGQPNTLFTGKQALPPAGLGQPKT